MTAATFPLFNTLFAQQREAIAREWLTGVRAFWGQGYNALISEADLGQQIREFLDGILPVLTEYQGSDCPVIPPDGPLAGLIRELSISRARLGFKSADTAQYVFALKSVLSQRLLNGISDAVTLNGYLQVVEGVLNQVVLMTIDHFTAAREKLIAQQNQSIQELSIPVIRIWDQVLLLPLIGVIDTLRARQFSESLLVAITRYEALITVVDVTGVPVFDTSVARHIMKVVDAAQLLGSRIILTGISPEGALTLTKLNISFSTVLCRASLRAGVAEALHMIGKRIVDRVGV